MVSNKAQDARRMRKQINLLNFIITRELSKNASASDAEQQSYACPYCGSTTTTKRGFDSSKRQRYQCKTCCHSFTSLTGGELSSTNLSLETWLSFAECHVHNLALRETADRCNVSLKTAWYMRQRLSSTIKRYSQQVKRNLKAIEAISKR